MPTAPSELRRSSSSVSLTDPLTSLDTVMWILQDLGELTKEEIERMDTSIPDRYIKMMLAPNRY